MRRAILVTGTCLCMIGASVALSPTQVGTAFIGVAFAKNGGGGNGNGGGNGGGNGHGGGEGHGNSSGHSNSGHSNSSQGKSTAKGADNNGHVHAAREAVDYDDDDEGYGLGALNAAHASATARAHASRNSSVGKIAAYERNREAALAISDPVTRADALNAAIAGLESDFGRRLTDAQIDRVNDLLDARR